MKRLHDSSLWRFVLCTMLVPLAFVAFWPSPVDQPVRGLLAHILNYLHGQGVPEWYNYIVIEAAANVALFVPLGSVSALAFPGRCWWQVGAFGLLISGAIELGQLLFLHNRFASAVDILANTSGAVLGGVLAGVLVKWLEARHLSTTDLQ